MRKRTLAREYALQILYRIDITRDSVEVSLAGFWQSSTEEAVDDTVKEFTASLVSGVVSNLEEIDKKIAQFAANWQLSRMPVVDRNILRISCYELIFRDDIPPKVSINEAVELAKKYSGDEAGKFVNAILDKIKQDKKR